jgi:hypothetical protein
VPEDIADVYWLIAIGRQDISQNALRFAFLPFFRRVRVACSSYHSAPHRKMKAHSVIQ